MKHFILFLIFASLALPLSAQTKMLLNLDDSGIALQGYDPVAFFTDHKPVPGSTAFAAKRDGAIYLFASKDHRQLFLQDPAKYEPRYGGYCAYGVSRHKLVKIDVAAFQIVDDHLLLQYSQGVRDDFNQDQKNNLAKADHYWPELVAAKGK